MRTSTIKIVLLLVVVLVWTVGCEETTVTTEVWRDGSLRRTIVIESDKSALSKEAFPIPMDDTWELTKSKKITKDNKGAGGPAGKERNHIYTAVKSFERVEDLNKEFFDNPDGTPKVKRFVELEKRFRWFYTFLTYREVCKKLNPFDRIPLEEYFTKEEMEIITLTIFDDDEAEKKYSKKKLAEIEDKFQDWMIKNVVEETYLALGQAAEKVKAPGLTPGKLTSHKESLFNAFKKSIDIFDNLSLDMVVSTCEEVLGVEEVAKLRQGEAGAFEELEAKMAAWEDLDIFSGFYNKVIMPGLIVGTNAGNVNGNMVTWEADIDTFLIMDYEMWVEARIVNWWAVGAAAIILILIIIALVVGALRPTRVGGR